MGRAVSSRRLGWTARSQLATSPFTPANATGGFEQVEVLRRQRRTGKQIAAELHLSPATVSRILKRLGLNRIDALEPALPVRRYEREKPGDMIHIDIKKLGRFNTVGHRITGDPSPPHKSRGAGWEFVHVAVDDHSRTAFARVMPSERRRSAITFLKAALAYYQSLGIKVERVMTDNGSCYKSFAFRTACKRLGLRHMMLTCEGQFCSDTGLAASYRRIDWARYRRPPTPQCPVTGDLGW
jgi:transposase InsO family protein